MLNTPILFIVFNRPETTRQVFEAIRKARPKYLFVAADGPRLDREGEVEKSEEVRMISTSIDWDCEVRTLFRKENLGCGRGPAEAISWFFNHVDRGIILEDDCLPDPSFFGFCERALHYYNDDHRIMHISGNNHLLQKRLSKHKPYFTRTPFIWGWATWSRAWQRYDFHVNDLRKSIQDKLIPDYWIPYFEGIDYEELEAWDYQWVYAIFKNKGLCLNPPKNLIYNIGFTEGATHTRNMPEWYRKIKLESLGKRPLIFPEKQINERIERILFDQIQSHKLQGVGRYFETIKRITKKMLFYKQIKKMLLKG